jgi:hypothetical protein
MKQQFISILVGSFAAAIIVVLASMYIGYGAMSYYIGAICFPLYFVVIALTVLFVAKAFKSQSTIVYSLIGFLMPSLIMLIFGLFFGVSQSIYSAALIYGIAGCVGSTVCIITQKRIA